MQRVWILNGNNINYDKDFTAWFLATIQQGIIEGFSISWSGASAEILPWKALIKCTRSNWDTFLATFENTENVAVDMSGTKKVYIVIDQDKIDDGTLNNENGTWLWEITTDPSTYPSLNFVALYDIISDVVWDDRVAIKLSDHFNATLQWNTFNIANTLLLLDWNWLIPVENMPPAELDIDVLSEDIWKYWDFWVIFDGIWNKKIKIENIQNALKNYQLANNLTSWEMVKLLNTWKIDYLDLVAFTSLNVNTAWVVNGIWFNIFKIDEENFCVLSAYNDWSTGNYRTSFVYWFNIDWTPYRRSAGVLTTSVTTSTSFTYTSMIPMWNNIFVFLYTNWSNYLYCTISEFNPTTWVFTHWAYQSIDVTWAVWNFNSWCRMTDTTLLVQYNANYIKKLTINTSTKVIVTNGTRYTITNSYWLSWWPLPITSWAEDVWAVIFHKNVSQIDIYACKITCVWHNITFSNETLLYNPWLTSITIRYWDNNLAVWWNGREMFWVWLYNTYWRCQFVRYDDTLWFQFSNIIDMWVNHSPDFLQWYDTNKFIVSVYDYDGTWNGRYYYIFSIADLVLIKDSETYITANTAQRKCIKMKNWEFYAWNDTAWNFLYVDWKIQDLSTFFWILQEDWLLDESKKVSRYWNISKIHSWLTIWKMFGYWEAISDTDILLFKNN